MRRALVVPALACAAACSAAEPPPPTVPLPSPAVEAAPPPPCYPARLPLEGLDACMPAEPTETRESMPSGSLHGLVASVPAGPATARFTVQRVRIDKAKAPLAKVDQPNNWTRVDASREVDVDGFPGRVMEGLTNATVRASMKVVAVGGSLYVAMVERPPEAAVDPRVVDAFLDSVRVEVPWRIHASPTDHYTIAVPEPAILGESTKATKTGAQMKMTTFSLGGRENMTFVVVLFPIPPGAKRSPDQMLDDAVRGVSDSGGAEVLKTRELRLGSLHGREVTRREASGSYVRVRFFLTASRFLWTGVEARSADAVLGADADRFLESVQIVE